MGGGGEEEVGQRVTQPARQVAGQAPIEQAEPAVGGHQHVAGVGVGMEKAGDQDLVQQRDGPRMRQRPALVGRERRLFHPAAVDAFHHQHPSRGEVADHLGRVDLVGRRVLRVEKLLVARLVAEIELLNEPGANLFDDARQIVGPQPGDVVMDARGKESDEVEVGFDHFLQIGPLDLHRNLPAIGLEPGKIDLGERGGSDRRLVELAEDLGGIAFQLFEDDRPQFGEGPGLDGVLQFLQLEHQRRGHQVGPHAEQLAELHERRPEFLGGEPDALKDAAMLPGRGHETLPPGARGFDLLDDLGEAVADEHDHDFLGPHGVGQQVEGLEGNARHGRIPDGRSGDGAAGGEGLLEFLDARLQRLDARPLREVGLFCELLQFGGQLSAHRLEFLPALLGDLVGHDTRIPG